MGDDLTTLISACRQGDPAAMDALVPLIYDELRRIARGHLGRERPDHTLQATALANETFLKLSAGSVLDVRDRQHFFALAGRQMRQILVDYARVKFAAKRGGRQYPIEFDDGAHIGLAQNPALLDLHDALEDLARRDPRQAQVVDLRFFGGLSNDDVAAVLACSVATVKRDWSMARAWLRRELDTNIE